MTYSVLVDDNFHFMDESERWQLGEFDTGEEAVAACKRMVDACLEGHYEPGMTAEALETRYKMFGDDPWIEGTGKVDFSAWDYAAARAKEMCAGRA